jgi:1-acyl-sn-glycerol-3-phosphate acyltransferase
MLSTLRYFIQGVLVTLAVFLNTVLSTVIVFLLAIIKLIVPQGKARNTVTHWLSSVGEYWVSFNTLMVWFLHSIKWDIQLPADLKHDSRYLVFCNHQSWVDIVVLQLCLNRRAPFGRFLLKHELIWVPFLGFCWWALDMAFLRRYSRKDLIKNPALRGKDLENAARACEKLKHIPVSMMTFPEGTRFSQAKHDQQKSPFRNLLRPRFGGIGQVLYSFDEAFECLLDVTIVYPDGVPSIWHYVSGQVKNISVKIQLLPIGPEIRGKDFREDPPAKAALVSWLNDIWNGKDDYITKALNPDENSQGNQGDSGIDQND